MASKVKFDFKLTDFVEGIKFKGESKEAVLENVADYVLKEVLKRVSDGNSPVSGHGRFKKLNKEYEKHKREEGATILPGTTNLEMTGSLLAAVEVVPFKGGLRLTVEDSEQPVADGHNNFSGKSDLPKRPFIPNQSKGETFKRDIIDGIKRIIREAKEEDEV